jgi:hypothetical protein
MRNNGAVGVQRDKSTLGTRLCLPSRAASDNDDHTDHDEDDDDDDDDAKRCLLVVSPCSSSWIQLSRRKEARSLCLCRYRLLECIAMLYDILMDMHRCF